LERKRQRNISQNVWTNLINEGHESAMRRINTQKDLIVFIGKPGAGKSTLINSLFSGCEVVDVLPYVLKHKQKGKVPEAQTIHAYREMYEHIGGDELRGDLVLELGTNHPELNVEELGKLEKKFNLRIFLCDAPKNVCRERAIKRGREFNKESLELRLRRDFPASHIKLFKEKEIVFDIIDMTRPVKKIANEIKKIAIGN
jgi:predicted kinase